MKVKFKKITFLSIVSRPSVYDNKYYCSFYPPLSSVISVLQTDGISYISCSQYLLTWIENNDWDMTSKRSEFCTALWIIHSNLWTFSFSIQHCFPSLDQLINVHRLDQHIYSMDSIWNSRWLWVACILFLRALVIYWAIICYVMVALGNRAT